MKDHQTIIHYPLSTEKSVKMMETQNKLTFMVEKKATKKDIKEAVQALFKVKVMKVNTVILPEGKKKAYVKLATENPAMDVATQLGLI